jgi:hypothetical protein
MMMFTLKDDFKSILYTLENIGLKNGKYNDNWHKKMSNIEIFIHSCKYIHIYLNIYIHMHSPDTD